MASNIRYKKQERTRMGERMKKLRKDKLAKELLALSQGLEEVDAENWNPKNPITEHVVGEGSLVVDPSIQKKLKKGGRRKTKRRKRKGGKSDLCKLYNKVLPPTPLPSRSGDGGGVSKKDADEYCAKYYLEDGTPRTPGRPSSSRPANKCTPDGCKLVGEGQTVNLTTGALEEREDEGAMLRAYFARQAAQAAQSTGGRRKTRRKKRKKKKRKTKKRRKRKKKKTKKRYRNQRGCKR